MPDYRVLSLWAPWSHGVACLLKTIETRGWKTPYRGRLLVHAAQKWTPAQRVAQRSLLDVAHASIGDDNRHVRAFAEPPALGAIVAACDLVDCRPTDVALLPGFDWVEALSPLDLAFGDFSPGRFGWFLEGVRALPEPIPCTGNQSLWRPSAYLVEQVEAALAAGVAR